MRCNCGFNEDNIIYIGRTDQNGQFIRYKSEEQNKKFKPIIIGMTTLYICPICRAIYYGKENDK